MTGDKQTVYMYIGHGTKQMENGLEDCQCWLQGYLHVLPNENQMKTKWNSVS